ncbi:unnamed protein product [Phaeothamnion confervicola]
MTWSTSQTSTRLTSSTSCFCAGRTSPVDGAWHEGHEGEEPSLRLHLHKCVRDAQCPLSVIGSARSPRCFRRPPPVMYFNQAKAWLDNVGFDQLLQETFLLHVHRRRSKPVVLLAGNCFAHGELLDLKGQISVVTLPPKRISCHQPMDQAIIATFKVPYRSLMRAQRVATLETRRELRAAAAARNVSAGMMGLA